MDQFPRRALDLLRGERLDFAHEVVQISVGKTVGEDIGVGARHFARRLVASWKSPHQRVFGEAQLVLSWQFGADQLTQFLHRLLHRFCGLVRLHARADYEWPLPLGFDDRGARSIGPVLVFAQVHVDARDETAAEDLVHRLEGDIVGVRARWREFDGHDQRLLGRCAIDQKDA